MTTQQEILEKFVIGALMWGNPRYLDRLLEEDFTSESAIAIFRELKSRYKQGLKVDNTIMLEDGMSPHVLYITECSDLFQEKHNTEDTVAHEIERLMRNSDLRHVFTECQAIARGIRARDIDTVDKASECLQVLYSTVINRHEIHREKMIGETVMDGLAQVDRNLSTGRVRIGFPKIDSFMGGGISLGEFVVIGARTSVGKSIISLSPILDTAKSGKWVMLCSNEMTDSQMSLRMLAKESQVEMGVIEKTLVGSGVQFQAIATGAFALKKLPIIMKQDCFTVSSIVKTLEERKKMGMPVSLVVVDYLQNMMSDNPRVNKQYDTLAEVSRALLGVAKKYNCVVIATSQVNRQGEYSEKIMISHLEGAGVIEQAADKIFLLYGNGDRSDPTRYIELAKNRSGRVSDFPFKMHLDGARMTLRELE